MRKFLLVSFLAFFSVASVFAQSRVVTGKVTSSEDGLPIPGVGVLIKGTTTGTPTDIDGDFRIEVPGSDVTLVFQAVGMITKEIRVANQSIINVVLDPDTQNLEEVIITAYGTANKGNFTGSAIALKGDQIANRPINNVVNAIEGQVAGVITTSANGQPGSTPAVRIRGVGSVNASSSPLYVVDGVPFDGNLSNLNPDDIEDMTVLKDASSAALYGSRAANGVIMITTKKGAKGKSNFSFKAQQGTSSRALPEYDRVIADQYYPLQWEALRNSQLGQGVEPSLAAQFASNELINVLGYNVYDVPNNEIVGLDGQLNPNAINNFRGLDWWDEIERTGMRGEYNMTYSGASERTDFYTSINYLKEDGYILKSDFERLTGRININTQATEWLKTGINLSATMSEGNNARADGGSSFVNPFFTARAVGPIYPVYAQNMQTGGFILDSEGNRIFDTGDLTQLGLPNRGSGSFPGRHVVQETLLNDDLFDRDAISTRFYVEASFLKNFTFRINASNDFTSLLSIGYDNTIVGDGAPAGRSRRNNSRTNSYTINQLLSYTNTFNDRHFVEVLVGHENYDYTFAVQTISKQDQILAGNTELDNFVTISSANGRVDRDRIESYFSRVNYVLDDKYSISASLRTDGSSRFSPESRWGTFFSVGGAWNIDKEAFFSSDFFQMLKLRASYGEVGNNAVGGFYPWQALYDLGFNNATEPGIFQASLSARELEWETNVTYDLGIDFAFGRRFSGTLEFFNRESRNLLFSVPLSLTTGLSSVFQNIGTMANQGFEFNIQGEVLRIGDFSWNANINASSYKNEFKELPFEEQITGTKKLVVGRGIYDFWLRDWYGVDPETGEGLYRADIYDPNDANIKIIGSDTLTTRFQNARFHFNGNAIPKLFGGIGNTFRYKSFSLSVLLSYSLGGQIYDGVYASLMSADPNGRASHVDLLDRWQQPGDITDVPKMDVTGATQTDVASDRWLVSSSYLNLRSVNLSYNVPKPLLDKLNMKQATVYLAGENLGWWSARRGMFVSGSFAGTTGNVYTPARTFTLGVNMNL